MMNKDLRFCFKAAGLMEDVISPEILAWWDEMSQELRGKQNEKRLETGRKGEQLTLQYEYKRVGERPVWKSVESNFAGYDILSVFSVEDRTPRLIEVKTSSATIGYSSMKITAKEWETACALPDRYFFYLWLLDKKPKLAILTQSDVRPHVAENQGRGVWEKVEIPFSIFASAFCDVNMECG